MNPDDEIKQPERIKEFETAVAFLDEEGNLRKVVSISRSWTPEEWKAAFGDALPKRKNWPTLDLQMKNEPQVKAPERTRHYEPQPDVDPDAAGKTVMVGFSVVSKTFSDCVNILAEAMPPKMNNAQIQSLLRRALKVGHGITFGAEENPELFFVINQDQKDALARVGIHAPTLVQLIGTCEAVGTTAEAAAARFRALKENQ